MKTILLLVAMASLLVGCAAKDEHGHEKDGHSEGDGHDHAKPGDVKEKGTQGRLGLAPGVTAHFGDSGTHAGTTI